MTEAKMFDQKDFIRDGEWHDLDLSSVIPEGAKIVMLDISVKNDIVSSFLKLRENGNINEVNIAEVRTLVAGVWNSQEGWVACDENRMVEYSASPDILLHVKIRGWL